MDYDILVWGKSKPGAHQAQEGDIIDVLPVILLDKLGGETQRQWAPNNKETMLCIIVPVSDLTPIQAAAMKESGILMKRKYKITLDDIDKITPINQSDVRDDKKFYQPILESNIVTDITKANIVKDKAGDVVDLGSIELRP